MSDDLPEALAALGARGARVVTPPSARSLGIAPRSELELCREALAAPIGAPRLADLAAPTSRVAVIVSDATRDEPREALLAAVREELSFVPERAFTIVVASGTHAPRPASTVVPPAYLARHPVVVHDGTDLAACVDLGTTAEGTRVRILRDVAQADLVVSLGRVRPHYFAGYSGGAKGIFPGCGLSVDVRQNHLWKADPSARLGRVDDNRCRLDMEAAARLVRGRAFLVNVIADVNHGSVDAVAGDLVRAHREAARRSARWFEVRAPRARVIVTSDRPPVTSSLYQASKLLPPAIALLEEGGTLVVVADCAEGTGPLETVNRGIYELGIKNALPAGHVVRLVSELPEGVARTTYATPAATLDAALRDAGVDPSGSLDGVVVLWRAGEMITRAEPGTARTPPAC